MALLRLYSLLLLMAPVHGQWWSAFLGKAQEMTTQPPTTVPTTTQVLWTTEGTEVGQVGTQMEVFTTAPVQSTLLQRIQEPAGAGTTEIKPKAKKIYLKMWKSRGELVWSVLGDVVVSVLFPWGDSVQKVLLLVLHISCLHFQ